MKFVWRKIQEKIIDRNDISIAVKVIQRLKSLCIHDDTLLSVVSVNYDAPWNFMMTFLCQNL